MGRPPAGPTRKVSTLKQLDSVVETVVQAGVEANTTRSYNTAVKAWLRFCGQYHLRPDGFHINKQFERFAGFLLAAGNLANTVKTYTGAVRAWARARGYTVCKRSFVEKRIVQFIEAQHGKTPLRKRGLTAAQLSTVCARLKLSRAHQDKMWLALVTVATFGLLRSEHFSAGGHSAVGQGTRIIHWDDVLWDTTGKGIFIILHRGKRQREPVGVWLPKLTNTSGVCCPVRALRDWWQYSRSRLRRGEVPSGPVFSSAKSRGCPLPYEEALGWAHALGVSLGLGGTALGTHTWRRTGLWLAESAKLTEDDCKLIGRWHSGVWRSYSSQALRRGQLCARMAKALG